MTAHTDLPNSLFLQDKPILGSTGMALRDNVAAAAEAASGAPVVVNGNWHPYDMVNIGDGATGKIYDFATAGAVASVETPAFADGFEYLLFIDRIDIALGGQSLVLEVYRETDAAYSTAWTSTGASDAGLAVNSAMIHIVLPRLSKTLHPVAGWAYFRDGGAEVFNPAPVYDSTVQKISKARIKWASSNIAAGAIYLFRRGVQV